MAGAANSIVETRSRAALKESEKEQRDKSKDGTGNTAKVAVLSEANTILHEAVQQSAVTVPNMETVATVGNQVPPVSDSASSNSTPALTCVAYQTSERECSPPFNGSVTSSNTMSHVNNIEAGNGTSGSVLETIMQLMSNMHSKLEQQLNSRFDQQNSRFDQQDSKLDQQASEMRTKLDQQASEMRTKLDQQASETRAMRESVISEVREVAAAIEPLRVAIEGHAVVLERHETEIVAIGSRVDEVDTRVASVTEGLSSLRSEVGAVTVCVGAQNTRIDGITTSVSEIETRVGENFREANTRINDVTACVDDVNSTVGEIKANLDALTLKISQINVKSCDENTSRRLARTRESVIGRHVEPVRQSSARKRHTDMSECDTSNCGSDRRDDSAFEDDYEPHQPSYSGRSGRASDRSRGLTPAFDYNHFLTVRKYEVFRDAPGGIHPMAWLEQFDFSLPPNWPEGHKIEFVCGHLEGEPATRMRSYPRYGENYGSFRQHFLASYWSENQQDRVRQSIQMMPPFTQSSCKSPTEFFQDLLNKNHFLSYPYSGPELIRICLGKLPRRLRNALLAGRCKDDVELFQELLEDLDFDYEPQPPYSNAKKSEKASNIDSSGRPKEWHDNGGNSGGQQSQSWGNRRIGPHDGPWQSRNRGGFRRNGPGRRRWGNGNRRNYGYNDRPYEQRRVHWERPSTPPREVEVRSPDPGKNRSQDQYGPSTSRQ